MISKQLLNELRKLVAKATPLSEDGLSYYDPHDAGCGSPCTPNGCHECHPTGRYEIDFPETVIEYCPTYFKNEADPKLLCLLRNNAKALLDEIERLQGENDRLNNLSKYL